jgi:MYXO-CTERM domain-containing protein
VRRAAAFGIVLGGSLTAAVAFAGGDDFSYNPPGVLVPGSGEGRVDEKVYAPAMRFPIEEGPAFANSQVWGIGGSQGPGGSQCSEGNFSYPWSDNYCETRSWDMPLCPSGTGHQGQDIRAATCDKDVHWVVASESGTVTNVGSYSVYITAADGTRYDYLHMGSVQVAVGDDVAKGTQIGKVSNEFGGTPTSVHLHFNLRQNVDGVGTVYVPPYMSLITSYQALVGPPPVPAAGALESVTCEGMVGFAQSPATPDDPIDVRFTFDGAAGEPDVVGYPFLADLERDDLCTTLGSCNHAFDVPPPLSLFDGLEHQVHAYASDGSSTAPELGTSPQAFTCTFAIPNGVRRKIRDLDSANAWRFSPFWDEIAVSDGIIESVDEGGALPEAPRLVASDAEPEVLFVIDGDKRRAVGSPAIARAWDLDARYAELLSAADLAAFPQGADLGPRPYVLRSAAGELWLVDAPPGQAPGGGGGEGAGGGNAADDDGGDGCSCRTATSTATAGYGLLALALVASLRRRRSA